MTGKLYGVSLGPGDPGLITRRSWELLHGDVFWTYPIRTEKSQSFALDIIRRAGVTLPKAHAPLTFPMTHDTEILAGYWLKAAEAVLEVLQQGQDVLFLVEGDASTYSTFGHLARMVGSLNESTKIETIAGVPSYAAAAAHLQFPLAETDETLAIIPAGYGVEMIDRLLADFDTLVLLKVKPLLDAIIDLLAERGLMAHSAFIEKAGTPQQRVERDLNRLRGEKVNYLSLLLVRNPHRKHGKIVRGCRPKRDA